MPELPNREIDLLKRSHAGDRDAFTLLYRAHQGHIFRFALLMTGDEVKAADITQDVFVWLLHHTAKFDPARGELKPFLTGVARKFLQRKRGEEMRWAPLDDEMEGTTDGEISDSDETEVLRRAITALPDKYRDVVVCCDLQEQSYEEAAVALDCAVGTVRSRLHRARALLARKLAKTIERKTEKCSA